MPPERFKAALPSEFMEIEVSALCHAAYGERTDERATVRNGYRDRELESRPGTLQLAVPRVRQGTYFPSFLEARRRWERAFVQVVAEAYALGVSTRNQAVISDAHTGPRAAIRTVLNGVTPRPRAVREGG